MSVGANKLAVGFAVQIKTLFSPEFSFPYPDTGSSAVQGLAAIHHPCVDPVEIGVAGRPQIGIVQTDFLFHNLALPCRQSDITFHPLQHFSRCIAKFCKQRCSITPTVRIFDIGIDKNVCTIFTDIVEMYKQATSCRFIGFNGVCDGNFGFGDHPDIPVNPAVIGKIKRILRFPGRVTLIIAIVGKDRDKAGITDPNTFVGKRQAKGEVSAQMFFYLFAVDIDNRLTHHCFKIERNIPVCE